MSLYGKLSYYVDFPWTKIGEKTISVSTTYKSELRQDTIHIDDIWDDSEIIYVRIRDTAGKRGGYFLGSDTFFINYKAANGDDTELTSVARLIHTYNAYYEQVSGNGYGVYAKSILPSGDLTIYSRYDASYSRRINGTYKIEVFKLKYPDQLSPFDI